jgi:uncharacterized peroxidase-related enzyme
MNVAFLSRLFANTGGVPLTARNSTPQGNTMSRISLLTASTAPADSRAVLEQIQQAFGATPNMFKAAAHSPAALKSLWGSFAALGKGSLPSVIGEKIAVAVAERNACDYCLAAHVALGRKAGATPEELIAAQMGEASDPQTAAALRFALKLVNGRGQLGDGDVQALREAGFGDEQVVEILAHVALNLFTNYLNVALDVPVDFPAVKRRAAA